MPAVAFDRFYRYDELTTILQGWADERPELFRLESIGSSFEDRDIWLATITNFESGADLDKPAFLIEANIHAIEVTGCTAALHLIDKLLTGYGTDPEGDPLSRLPRFLRDSAAESRRRRARPGRPSALRALERQAVPSPRRAGRPLRGGRRR